MALKRIRPSLLGLSWSSVLVAAFAGGDAVGSPWSLWALALAMSLGLSRIFFASRRGWRFWTGGLLSAAVVAGLLAGLLTYGGPPVLDDAFAMALFALTGVEMLILAALLPSRPILQLTGVLAALHFLLAAGRPGDLFVVGLIVFVPVSLSFWLLAEAAAFGGAVSRYGRTGAGGRFARRVAGRTHWRRAVLTLLVVGLGLGLLLFLAAPRAPIFQEDGAPGKPRDRGGAASADPNAGPGLPLDGAGGGDVVTVRRFGGRRGDPLLDLLSQSDLDETPVLLVRCERARDGAPWRPDGALLLRGMTLWRYVRGGWRGSKQFRRLEDADDGRADGRIVLPDATPGRHSGAHRLAGGVRVRQEVLAAPIGTAAVFVLPRMESVEADALYLADDGTINWPAARLVQYSYAATSRVRNPAPRALRTDTATLARLDEVERAAGASRPAGGRLLPYFGGPIPPAAARLAADAARGAPSDYDRCLAIAMLLRRRCAYAEEPPAFPRGRDPVEAFLTTERRGVCSHFASAMTLMLRSLDIPARMAIGFRTEEFHETTGAWVARRSHAHAWVEVYFRRHGWVTFDPTPPTPGAPVDAPVELARANWPLIWAQYGPAAWAAWLGRYGEAAQARLFARTRWIWRNGGWQILSALAAVWLLWRLLRRRWRRWTNRTRPRPAAVGYYEEFIRVLARHGIRRGAAETPRELAQRARERLPAAEVDLVTEVYCATRFGGHRLGPETAPVVHEALGRLRSAAAQ